MAQSVAPNNQFSKGCGFIKVTGDEADDERFGYPENNAQTAYLNVPKDKIIYNEYENSNDRKFYNKGYRTVIKTKHFF